MISSVEIHYVEEQFAIGNIAVPTSLPCLASFEGEPVDAELQSRPGTGLKDLAGLLHGWVGSVGQTVHQRRFFLSLAGGI